MSEDIFSTQSWQTFVRAKNKSVAKIYRVFSVIPRSTTISCFFMAKMSFYSCSLVVLKDKIVVLDPGLGLGAQILVNIRALWSSGKLRLSLHIPVACDRHRRDGRPTAGGQLCLIVSLSCIVLLDNYVSLNCISK